MGPTFSTILNEFWTDFLQFSAKDGEVSHPPTPPLMCAPEAYEWNMRCINVRRMYDAVPVESVFIVSINNCMGYCYFLAGIRRRYDVEIRLKIG